MRPIKVKRNLECLLTDGELKECSKALAEALTQRARIEAKLDTFKAQVKAEVAACDATIGKMANMVSTEHEYREVECQVIYDWGTGIKSFVRMDTAEIVGSDEITAEERQDELEFQKAQQEELDAQEAAAGAPPAEPSEPEPLPA